MSSAKKGDRVAHKELDDSAGAHSGVVRDVVGDEKQKMVIVESERGDVEAFDSRELVSLGGSSASSGPVILKPRHFFKALKNPSVILAIILEVVLIATLPYAAFVWGWEAQSLVLLAGLLLVVALVLLLLLDRSVYRKNI